MDATTVVHAEGQPAPGDTVRTRAITRFRVALELFTTDATLTELRLAGSRNQGLLRYYERERARLMLEFEALPR